MEVNEGPSLSNGAKHGNDEAGMAMLRRRSLDLEYHHINNDINNNNNNYYYDDDDEVIRKTKSLNNQILINVDELVKNVSKRFNPTNSTFAFHGISHPSDNLSADTAHQTGQASEQDIVSNSSCRRNESFALSLPICLRFQDVKFKVTMNNGGKNLLQAHEKQILHGVSGSVSPGELLAMIGPSGGGKTTLLNLLSGRSRFNSGTITYNNQPYSKSLKRKIGFVLQDDVVFPHLTVKETLTYAALLRLPNNLSKEQKKDRVMKVIIDLGLERCQDSMVGGGLLKGISGGERRRVCIGNEILINPTLLLLDEPTSSLDSASALKIVQLIHNMAKEGKTIVTTIHQPSSRLFSKFDKLILLGKGSSFYFGKASEAMKYFSSMGCSPLIPMNPAEFLLDVANGNMNDKSIPLDLENLASSTNTRERPSPLEIHEYFVEANKTRNCRMRKPKILKSVFQQNEFRKPKENRWISEEWELSWLDQFCVLLSRGIKERRHEYFSSVRVVQVISTAIITGLLWWNPNYSSPIDVEDQEKTMLMKERSVEMYRLSAYFAARNITDLLLDLILPVFFMLIVYFMVGLQPSFAAFSLTLLTVFLSIVAAQGLGLSIGAAFMDVKKAMTLGSIIIMFFMLSGGFFIQDVPRFMSWVRYVSFNYHTFRLLLGIQYGCSTKSSNSGTCEAPLVKGLKVDYSGKVEVGALIIMIIGYRLLGYFFLRRMKYKAI